MTPSQSPCRTWYTGTCVRTSAVVEETRTTPPPSIVDSAGRVPVGNVPGVVRAVTLMAAAGRAGAGAAVVADTAGTAEARTVAVSPATSHAASGCTGDRPGIRGAGVPASA